jgi:cobalt/nickel transport system permease protein
MHIPDGFLDTKTITATTAFAATGVGAAWRQIRLRFPQEQIPLLGLAAAFVFAAQMLNFPVAGGTSGHLMGSVLATVLLGPGAAIIVMSSVLLVQCLLFADGGLLALGANIFNMAIVGVLTGHGIYAGVQRIFTGPTGRIAAIALASWCSVMLASLCCAGELAWSGTVSWRTAFPAMSGIHAIIGAGEAMITCLVVIAILRGRPGLIESTSTGNDRPAYGTFVLYGILVAVGLVLFVSPFASDWPDGLEKVAATFGFEHRALEQPIVPGVIPDYAFPGIGSPTAGMIVAGIAGLASVFVVVYLLGRLLRSRS